MQKREKELRRLLKKSENKNLDLILEYFNFTWQEIEHKSTVKNPDYLKPRGMAKQTVMLYLDYCDLAPVEIKNGLGLKTFGSRHIINPKERLLKYKTINHLLFEILKLDYEKFIKRSKVFYETFD